MHWDRTKYDSISMNDKLLFPFVSAADGYESISVCGQRVVQLDLFHLIIETRTIPGIVQYVQYCTCVRTNAAHHMTLSSHLHYHWYYLWKLPELQLLFVSTHDIPVVYR